MNTIHQREVLLDVIKWLELAHDDLDRVNKEIRLLPTQPEDPNYHFNATI